MMVGVYLNQGESPGLQAGRESDTTLHKLRSTLSRGILPDFLLAFEEQPLPRQSTVLLQFLQPLILFLVIELDSHFDHAVTHKPHLYVCSDTLSQ